MGLIISRFRKKETTIEVLEGIDKDISRLQKNRKDNQDRQKRIATSLLIYSFVLYVLSAVIFFFLYFPDTWPLRFLYSLPLLAFPFLIWGVKKLLHWYFVKRIHANDLALRDLRDRKRQILEDVMETETYKKAKEILEKFDPARFKRLESNEAISGSISPTSTAPGLHHRKPASQPTTPKPVIAQTPRLPTLSRPSGANTPNPFMNTPLRVPAPAVRPQTPLTSMTTARQQSMPRPTKQPMTGSVPNTPAQMVRGPVMGPRFTGPPGPPMPRSVLPRERGTMDRLMDYLVGDGPENRYALICSICSSHNGMALKEEFEYLSFRCCYCYNYNPARKQRPMAPRLEFFTPQPNMKLMSGQDESDDEDDDEEDDDEEEATEKSDPKGDTKKASAAVTASTTTTTSTTSSSPKRQVGAPSPSPRGQKRIPAKFGGQTSVGGKPRTGGSVPLRGEPSKPVESKTFSKSALTQAQAGPEAVAESSLKSLPPNASGNNSNGSVTMNRDTSLPTIANTKAQNEDNSEKILGNNLPFVDDSVTGDAGGLNGAEQDLLSELQSAMEDSSSKPAVDRVSDEGSSEHKDQIEFDSLAPGAE